MALTTLAIKNAKAKDTAYRLSDERGLYLWITPAGGKLWRWGYVYEGKEKLMSFGKYPDVPLLDARERHATARKLLASGVDPMAQRKAEKTSERIANENSFANVAALWLEHWQDGKSLRHVDSTRRRLAANILPSLGPRPMAEIEAPEIVAMVRLIERRGARDIAKRALETAGQIFRYGIAHGFAKRNPATEIRPSDILKTTHKVNYARIDAKDLPHLLRQIDIYPGKHVTRLAIKLMALPVARAESIAPCITAISICASVATVAWSCTSRVFDPDLSVRSNHSVSIEKCKRTSACTSSGTRRARNASSERRAEGRSFYIEAVTE